MASVGFHHSEPVGEGFLAMHSGHIEQGQGFGQITGLLTVVLTDGSSFLPQVLQVFWQAIDQDGYNGVNRLGTVQEVFLFEVGGDAGNKKPPQWAVCGGARMTGFGVYVPWGSFMNEEVDTGASAKRSHRASKVASVQILGT